LTELLRLVATKPKQLELLIKAFPEVAKQKIEADKTHLLNLVDKQIRDNRAGVDSDYGRGYPGLVAQAEAAKTIITKPESSSSTEQPKAAKVRTTKVRVGQSEPDLQAEPGWLTGLFGGGRRG